MATSPIFLPKLVTCLRGYTRRQLGRDSLAGVTVGVIALPLALAFGIASIPPAVAAEVGISPPVMGLITAIVAGFLISALGGSRVSIGGPTGAFVVIIYAIASRHGYDGLVMATIMAGLILMLLGVTRLGSMIKYIPYPVTTGFTSGIAVIIFTGQIKDLLGVSTLGDGDVFPPEFIGKIQWYASHAGAIDWTTAAIGVGCAVVIFVWPKLVSKRVPGTIVVLIGATALVKLLGLDVETIGSRFGAIPSGLPMPRAPSIDLDRVPDLIGPAFTIAILCAIESLLCAVVADGMLRTRHRSNTELIAQGVANVAAPIFGGVPATSAIARTAANVQSGGRTPVAGLVHSLTLLVIMLFLARYAAWIPLCALAAVLVVVAYNMSEFRRFRWLLTGPRSDVAVLLVTFSLTVLIDLTVAVQVGLVLAALLFIKRMADVTNVGAIQSDLAESGEDREGAGANGRRIDGVEVYEINGPFFFGAAYKLRDSLELVARRPKALILDMEKVSAMDATGLHALDEMRRHCAHEKTRLILSGVHAQPLMAMSRSGLIDAVGSDNMAGTVTEALVMAREGIERTAGVSSGVSSGDPDSGAGAEPAGGEAEDGASGKITN